MITSVVLVIHRTSKPDYKNCRSPLTGISLLKTMYTNPLQSDSFPLIIGGDHSVSIGSIAAISKYCEEVNLPLSVLWFDAHTDFNTFDTTPSGNIHGMPAAVIAGLGHPALLSIGHKTPLVEPENIYQVGIRSVDATEKWLISESNVQVFDMRLIDEKSVHRIIEHILGEVRKKSAYLHVSFDIDCLARISHHSIE